MKKISIVILAVLFISVTYGQTGIDDILSQIEQNNITLKYYRQLRDAKKLGNKTGLLPENPEVEIGMLSGSPSGVGSRTDISITQSLDFPGSYIHKYKLSDIKNEITDTEYEVVKYDVILQAKKLFSDIVYRVRMDKELANRVHNAELIAVANTKMFENGEVGIIEKNKANLFYVDSKREYEDNKTDLLALKEQLYAMNGGNIIEFKQSEIVTNKLPDSFDSYYTELKQKSPAFMLAGKNVDAGNRSVKLARSLTLPRLSVGFMTEDAKGAKYSGVKFGVSVPLWAGKNKVKSRKAEALAASDYVASLDISEKARYKTLFDKAKNKKMLLEIYQSALESSNSSELLKKAYDKGELSLINYIMELNIFYEYIDELYQTQRDYEKLNAELTLYY
jgi:outer membrane protein TolC